MEEMIEIVRVLIGDMDPAAQTFDNDRIQASLTVAGLMVSRDIDLDNDYTFDITNSEISPDPYDQADYDAVALFTLRAACILNQNQYISAVGAGIRVRDGTSEVDTTSGFSGYKDILTMGPCHAYQKLLKDLISSGQAASGRAVLSPFSDGYSPAPHRIDSITVGAFFDRYLGSTI